MSTSCNDYLLFLCVNQNEDHALALWFCETGADVDALPCNACAFRGTDFEQLKDCAGYFSRFPAVFLAISDKEKRDSLADALSFYLPSAAFNPFRRKSPPNAFDNFLHRKPKHRPASFPPPPSTFVTAKVCRMDLKMRENIPTPVHATAPQFFRYPLRRHPIQDTARLHGIPSLAWVRQERSRKTEQTGNTKPEKHCNTRGNRKIELLLLRKNRFSRHRRQKLKASNTATDHHQSTERPPEIAQSPPQTAKSHMFFASLPPLSRKKSAK